MIKIIMNIIAFILKSQNKKIYIVFCKENYDSYILIGHFIYDELLVQPAFMFNIGRFFYTIRKENYLLTGKMLQELP